MDERSDERTDQPYEPPSAEDVATDDTPSVTAAGGTKTVGAG